MAVTADDGKRWFPALEAVRALCTLFVFAYHLLVAIHPETLKAAGLDGIAAWLWYLTGDAIAVFFVVSGFVVSNSFAQYRGRFGDLRAVPVFLAARAMRIWSVAIPVTVFAVAAVEGYRRFTGHAVSLNFFNDTGAIAASAFGYGYEWHRAGWTLFYELWAYAVLPFAVLALTARQWKQRAAYACVAAAVFYAHWSPALQPYLVAQLLGCFAAGAAMYACVIRWGMPRIPRVWAWAASLVALLAIAVMAAFNARTSGSWGYMPARVLCDITLVAAALAADAWVARNAQRRWLAALQTLGGYSYSLYLWHMPVMVACTVWLFGSGYAQGSLQVLVFLLVAPVCVALATMLSGRFIERRARMGRLLSKT